MRTFVPKWSHWLPPQDPPSHLFESNDSHRIDSETPVQATDKTPKNHPTECFGGLGGSLKGPSQDSAELPDMPIRGSAEAGLAVTVRSELLGREVLFVSDDVPEGAIRDMQGVVDRARELRALESDKPLARHLGIVLQPKKSRRPFIGGARAELKVFNSSRLLFRVAHRFTFQCRRCPVIGHLRLGYDVTLLECDL